MTDSNYFHHTRVQCPHCGIRVRLEEVNVCNREGGNIKAAGSLIIGQDNDNDVIHINLSSCPACRRSIVFAWQNAGGANWLVWPRTATRPPLHPSVPKDLRDDYSEAAIVLNDSPKASAALSRRCLQALLVKQGAKKRDLEDQLEELYATLPLYVHRFVDNIRKLGNISAHTKESRATGEIVDVGPGEAEWMLELLEALFEHYYAKPAEYEAKHAAMTAKYADAGKLTK